MSHIFKCFNHFFPSLRVRQKQREAGSRTSLLTQLGRTGSQRHRQKLENLENWPWV